MRCALGFCFSCQRCLHCCSGEPGFVFLSKDDIRRACVFLDIPQDEFIGIYCRLVDYGTYSMVSLKERYDYSCIFLNSDGCSIYPARPLQCRTYPFWRGLADDEQAVKREMENCPGLGKGTFFSDEQIMEMIKENDFNEPLCIMKKN